MQEVKGYFIELQDYSSNRIIFSASTETVDESAFSVLWNEVGKFLYRSKKEKAHMTYQVRISPIYERF